MSKISIMIVDDDSMVLDSLKLVFEKKEDIDVLATALNGSEAMSKIEQLSIQGQKLPDIVLMDIQMPEMDGIKATSLMKNKYSSIRIMMLTTFEDEHNIRKAILAGAEGYLIKSSEISLMAEKIRAMYSGAIILDHKALHELTKPKGKVLEQLSLREHEIVVLIGQGYSNKEIAQQLHISEGTVRNNLSVVLEKLNLRDRTQLAVFYLNS